MSTEAQKDIEQRVAPGAETPQDHRRQDRQQHDARTQDRQQAFGVLGSGSGWRNALTLPMPAETSASAVAHVSTIPIPARGSARRKAQAVTTSTMPTRRAPPLKIHGAVEPSEPRVLASRCEEAVARIEGRRRQLDAEIEHGDRDAETEQQTIHTPVQRSGTIRVNRRGLLGYRACPDASARSRRPCRRGAAGSASGCSPGIGGTAATLPWRKTDDPYHILVSEIMLQQTQVDRVLPKYAEWLDEISVAATRWPTRREAEVDRRRGIRSATTSGRGACRRSRAKAVARYGGQLPSDEETLLSFKGIGAYTAGAIRSFAFRERAAILDTNVARVLFRVFVGERRSEEPRDEAAPVGGVAKRCCRTRHVFDFNQALMDFGAMVCVGAQPEVPESARWRAAASPSRQQRHQPSVGFREWQARELGRADPAQLLPEQRPRLARRSSQS